MVQTLAYDAENRLAEVVSTPEASVTLTLKAGWNFVSLPVVPADPSSAGIFGTSLSTVSQISRYDATTARFSHWVGNPKFDQFSSLQAGVGYQVYCQRAVSVTVQGRVAALPAQSLAAGWSLLPAMTTAAGTASCPRNIPGLWRAPPAAPASPSPLVPEFRPSSRSTPASAASG